MGGRNMDFHNAEAVTVKLEPSWTVSYFLALTQHQHVASYAYGGMGLTEFRERCTNRLDDAPDWFDSVVHQFLIYIEMLPFAKGDCLLETVYPHEEPFRE